MMEGQFHSLIDIFKTGKEQYPEKTAIIMGEDTRTYGQIFDKKNNNLYNKNHVNELPLYHDKAIRNKRRAIYTGGR